MGGEGLKRELSPVTALGEMWSKFPRDFRLGVLFEIYAASCDPLDSKNISVRKHARLFSIRVQNFLITE
jgi:hypothetical protein